MKFDYIVLIDDCDMDRYLLRRQVKKISLHGSLHEAENGLQAISMLKDLARTNEYSGASLILLDINMPIMGGFEFLAAFAELRNDMSLLQSAKVVVLSSSDTVEDRVRALKHEFVIGCLPKGSDSSEAFNQKIQDLVA